MAVPPVPSPSDPLPPPLRDWHETVVGGKFVRLLERHVQDLRERTPHGNRALFLDDVFVLSLLAFHNPTLRSLRTFEDFSQTRQAQKFLSVTKVCRSTLSDFHQLADPTRLEPILKALRGELSRKQLSSPDHSGLQGLLKQTVAVDGTWMTAMADVAWAIVSRNQHAAKAKHRARLDFHIDVHTQLPEVIVVPDPGQSESESAAQQIQPDKIYLYDRGYSAFQLIDAHYERNDAVADDRLPEAWTTKAEFVIRYKPAGNNAPELQAAVARELTDADRAAGIISDRTGVFRSSAPSRHRMLSVPLREVVIQIEEQGEPKSLRLITNLLDVPATTIGLLYRQRWQVELFFRWLKTVWNFRHLISHTRAGLLTQLYVTLIGVMLMYLHTGYRPSKYLFSLLSTGASLEDILPILERRERERELNRQSAARRAAQKKSNEPR